MRPLRTYHHDILQFVTPYFANFFSNSFLILFCSQGRSLLRSFSAFRVVVCAVFTVFAVASQACRSSLQRRSWWRTMPFSFLLLLKESNWLSKSSLVVFNSSTFGTFSAFHCFCLDSKIYFSIKCGTVNSGIKREFEGVGIANIRHDGIVEEFRMELYWIIDFFTCAKPEYTSWVARSFFTCTNAAKCMGGLSFSRGVVCFYADLDS